MFYFLYSEIYITLLAYDWVWAIVIKIKNYYMSIFKVILVIIFPPLAVIGDGCGSIIIVSLLTLCGWIPGVIAALIISNRK